MLARRQA